MGVLSSIRSKEDHNFRRIILDCSERNDIEAFFRVGRSYKKGLSNAFLVFYSAINYTQTTVSDFNRNMKTSTLFLGALAAFQYALAASVNDKCTVGYCTLNGG